MFGTNIADFDTDDEAIAKAMRGYLRQVEDVFCTVLTRAQKAGEISSTLNPRDLARLLLCTAQGVALLGRVMEDGPMLAGAVQAELFLLKNS